MAESQSSGAALTCLSCQLIFSTSTEQKEHYKSDFHRFNLKRKVVGLPPITMEMFLKAKSTSDFQFFHIQPNIKKYQRAKNKNLNVFLASKYYFGY